MGEGARLLSSRIIAKEKELFENLVQMAARPSCFFPATR
jgi:hypothetical protein